MGFRVTQPIETQIHGSLSEFYVRLENVVINRIDKKVIFCVGAYPSYEACKSSYPRYKGENFGDFTPYIIPNPVIYGDSTLDYPNFKLIDLTPEMEINDLYPKIYEATKNNYGEIFGSSNIIDEI
jgi:hypothetical protein